MVTVGIFLLFSIHMYIILIFPIFDFYSDALVQSPKFRDGGVDGKRLTQMIADLFEQ